MNIAIDSRVADLTAGDRRILLERRPTREAELQDRVRRLIGEVREEGDSALHRMAREFDGVELEDLEIPRDRWMEARDALDPAVRRELERAARNIETFHRDQLPDDLTVETEPGVRLGRRAFPLNAAGVYAPGGRAAYPSSVLMGVVPARAAGVAEIVVCSPPGPSGEPAAETLAACAIGGATRLFAIGGAGAVSALAFGTDTVPRVDVIVGPGNRWVTEAKRQVAGRLRTDAPAGPSEVFVVAAPGVDPERVAAELVAQAEHDPEAAVAAVTWDGELLDRIRQALVRQSAAAARAEVVQEALARRGALLLAADREEALALSEAYAAEHLALFTDDPHRDLATQSTAGTVFLGEASTVAFGDYLTGANHVLPTAGLARVYSGLSTLDFMRFLTWQEASIEGASRLAEGTACLAEAEGLHAHAAAARMRERPDPSRAGTGERGK